MDKNSYSLFNKRHGGAWDRGSADAWYRRAPEPHYYAGATRQSDLIPESDMTPDEVADYNAGYAEQMLSGEHKEWGFATDEIILVLAFIASAWFFIVPMMAWLVGA